MADKYEIIRSSSYPLYQHPAIKASEFWQPGDDDARRDWFYYTLVSSAPLDANCVYVDYPIDMSLAARKIGARLPYRKPDNDRLKEWTQRHNTITLFSRLLELGLVKLLDPEAASVLTEKRDNSPSPAPMPSPSPAPDYVFTSTLPTTPAQAPASMPSLWERVKDFWKA